MNRAVVGGALAILYGWCAWRLPPVIGWAFAWTSASAAWVAVVYTARRPGWFGKQVAPRLAAVLLFPFLGSVRLLARLPRRMGAPERSEVAPGLWVGGWPSRGPSPLAHLDCTAELPRRAEPAAYRCIPMLDAVAMSAEALHTAVAQVRAWREEGRPVLVHCAYGHGRSVAVVVVVLVREGLAADVDAALDRVRALRPGARLVGGQREVVDAELAGGHGPPPR